MTRNRDTDMLASIRSRRRLLHCRAEFLVVVVASLSALQRAAALITNPRQSLLLNNGLVAARAFSKSILRADTKLKTKQINYADDDFASFNDGDAEDDVGRELAREFFQELEYRQSRSPSEFDAAGSDETYSINSNPGGKDRNAKDASKSAIRSVTIRANGNANAVSRQRFVNKPTASSRKESSSQPAPFPLFPFFSFPTPAPRPAASAGLFSGSGTTVYSSGRSIRAEIEILETTIRNNDTKRQQNQQWSWDDIYVGDAEQLEEVLRLVALSLIVASAAYVAIEASGATVTVVSWDEAAASAHQFIGLVNDATKDGMSGIKVSVSKGDVFLGDEAAWLARESSEFAAHVSEAVRSVEDLVLS